MSIQTKERERERMRGYLAYIEEEKVNRI